MHKHAVRLYKTRIPSAETLRKRLNLSHYQARCCRAALEWGRHQYDPGHALDLLQQSLRNDGRFHGREYAPTTRDTSTDPKGAEYLNAGDTYACTVLYDHKRGTFRVTSLGDFIETQERRRTRKFA